MTYKCESTLYIKSVELCQLTHLFESIPNLKKNSKACKSWKETEPLTISKIIFNSDSTIEINLGLPIQTRVKNDGVYSFGGEYHGIYTG